MKYDIWIFMSQKFGYLDICPKFDEIQVATLLGLAGLLWLPCALVGLRGRSGRCWALRRIILPTRGSRPQVSSKYISKSSNSSGSPSFSSFSRDKLGVWHGIIFDTGYHFCWANCRWISEYLWISVNNHEQIERPRRPVQKSSFQCGSVSCTRFDSNIPWE